MSTAYFAHHPTSPDPESGECIGESTTFGGGQFNWAMGPYRWGQLVLLRDSGRRSLGHEVTITDEYGRDVEWQTFMGKLEALAHSYEYIGRL